MAEASEHRNAQRRRVIKRVTIASDARGSRMPCLMKNVSDTGALLEFETDLIPPETFIVTNDLDGYRVPAEIVRHEGRRYGIRFTGPRQTIPPTRTQQLQPGLATPDRSAPAAPRASVAAPQARPFGRRRK